MASGAPAVGLPSAIAGIAVRDAVTLDAYSSDFGGLESGVVHAAVYPRGTDELPEVIGALGSVGRSFTVRGRGYSQSGQAVPRDGIAVCTERMDRIHPPNVGRRTLRCEAGARVASVFQVAQEVGLVPNVLPLNLDMTVGGLLSAGGIGSNSFRYGPVVANVENLRVVTADGNLWECSADANSDLFHAALAGLGRCGIIAEAVLTLRRSPRALRCSTLEFSDLADCLAATRALCDCSEVDSLEVFCWRSSSKVTVGAGGLTVTPRWAFTVLVAREIDTDDETPGQVCAVEQFANRYRPRFAEMVRSGQWWMKHPWFEVFVSPEKAEGLVREILGLLPPTLGDGHRLFWIDGSTAPPFFMTPPHLGVGFAVLPMGLPDSTMNALRGLYEQLDALCRRNGAHRYLSGWIPERNESRWQEHFGDRFARWCQMKGTFDPNDAFASAFQRPC